MSLPDRAHKEHPLASYASLIVRHLTHGHSFGFTDVSIPALPVLVEIHDELHEQERGRLATHEHLWVLIEIHSGDASSPPFPTREKAYAYAVSAFGPEAGKEYVVVRWI